MSSLFTSKNDSHDIRLGDLCGVLKPGAFEVSIFGAPDDEGIRRNGGREGAHHAPTEIRRAFLKMTPSRNWKHPLQIQDLGDTPLGLNLENRHQYHEQTARKLIDADQKWIALGGGHDYGYPHAAAFLRKWSKGVVINFDAHLDCRPADKGHHSGTPFRRLLENFTGFRFYELGLQEICNSPDHLTWAEQKKAHLHFLDENLLQVVQREFQKREPCFLSIDMDVFSSAYAPGCSQSWPYGMQPEAFFQVLEFLFQTLDVKGVGIYEVSPPLDVDHRTSKLAAQIMHRCLSGWMREVIS